MSSLRSMTKWSLHLFSDFQRSAYRMYVQLKGQVFKEKGSSDKLRIKSLKSRESIDESKNKKKSTIALYLLLYQKWISTLGKLKSKKIGQRRSNQIVQGTQREVETQKDSGDTKNKMPKYKWRQSDWEMDAHACPAGYCTGFCVVKHARLIGSCRRGSRVAACVSDREAGRSNLPSQIKESMNFCLSFISQPWMK